jgi:hypothetical protein
MADVLQLAALAIDARAYVTGATPPGVPLLSAREPVQPGLCEEAC